MIARILTLLAAAIKESQAAPGYTYKGTIIFKGSELTGVIEHKSVFAGGLEVGAAVAGLEVGAAVAGLEVGAAVAGAEVGRVVGDAGGLVVGAAVAGRVVGDAGGLDVGAAVAGVEEPPNAAPVLIT
jgi:hypothetical protein